jgi:FG-GAP repeat
MKKQILSLILFAIYIAPPSGAGGLHAQTIDPNFVQIPKVAALPGCVVADKGKTVYNNTDNKMYYCNGTAWQSMTPAASAGPGWSQTGADIANTNAGNVGIRASAAPLTALDLGGDLSLRTGSLALVGGLNNNVDIATDKKTVYNTAVTGAGGAQISGFAGGVDGRIITIFNNSTTNALQLYDESNASSGSTATNKILTGTGQSAVIYGNGAVTLRYDGPKQRWTILSSNYVDGLSTAATTTTPGAEQASGVGTWGDCTMGSITSYFPVANQDGQSNDNFGRSVAISGDYAIVGSPYDNESGFAENGSASIYKRNVNTGAWEQQGNKLLNQNPANYDNFGFAVAISGDFAIVGAIYDDEGFTNNGSATVFKRNTTTSTWEQQGNKLINANPGNDDNFGNKVAISGDYAIVGAYQDSEGGFTTNGSATIFKRNTNTGAWEQQGNKLINQNPVNGDSFGASVSISGDYALVGSPYDDEGFTDNGSATVFKRDAISGLWQQQGSKLVNYFSAQGDQLGYSVSISGDYAIVGSPYDDEGFTDNGSATVFKRNTTTGTWEIQGSKLINSNSANNNYFGYSVSISGDYAIIGSVSDNVNGLNIGSATIFKRIGNIWNTLQKVTKPNANSSESFGISTGIDSNGRFLIGASFLSGGGMAFFGKVK